ncbi:unnamed protein product [Didymodactylos carnosus]|uniref:G-protein coupled receptors family 1 profile domain-containing protein n=1 Tax=Didymodactylos carnosus TaxID=1234261 RepID=A0A815SNM3_9BILA|nr:unnamed protein product [Didymodactylos carnosus]CAF1492184.1 unnamed protein product [Didymodactylos carnosus]CAF4163904.1 unnamed protein product [Didymodactylos carnosus]CAF4355107.1 unnamed protein product [Didymodactylos carnosus]
MSHTTFPQTFREIMATICFIFGFPGNLLTIIICIKALHYRKKINFERKIFDLYLVEISILDTILLTYWVLDTAVVHLYDSNYIRFQNLINISEFCCFFFFMLNRLCAALCSWLIMFFTLIRFIHIFRPLNTIRSNVILVILLLGTFGTLNTYLVTFLRYENQKQILNNNLTTITTTTKTITLTSWHFLPLTTEYTNVTLNPLKQYICSVGREYEHDRLRNILNTIFTGVFSLAIPSIITLIVNIVILAYIQRVYNINGLNRINNNYSNYRSTPLLVISITYTLCYLPYCIIYFSQFLFSPGYALSICSSIVFTIRYISHSSNFYAYIFTSLRFRRDIKSLFRMLVCVTIKTKDHGHKKKDNYCHRTPHQVMIKSKNVIGVTGQHDRLLSLPATKNHLTSKRRIVTIPRPYDVQQPLRFNQME